MTTQIAPDRLGLPPPAELDLVDAGRVTGWIIDATIGFRGFANATEATHAAWIAHRTLARRLARTHGTRPVPIAIEPLSLQRIGDRDVILASGQPIAGLIRPGADSRSGADSFGFELAVPAPHTELELRAIAYLLYRTLRKSGVRWAMWRPAVLPGAGAAASTATTARVRPAAANEPNATPRVTGTAALAVLTVVAALSIITFGSPSSTFVLTAILLAALGARGVMAVRTRRFP